MKKIIVLALSIVVISGLLLAGCKDSGEKKVELVYVEWSCATASTHVVKAILEDEMGYKVEATPVGAAAMFQAIASSDADAMTTAWLPATHKDYMDQVGDKVDDLGPNFKGAKIGLVVPSYVDIDSVEELADNADKFGGKIIGIDPGAGLMKATEKFLEKNDLGDKYNLVEGSGATMTAALEDAINNNEPVLVTGWIPHWKFGRWDIKLLKDPNEEFGASETINTIVRKGLEKDMPKVYHFLNNFAWSKEDIHTVMAWNQENGADPDETARKWIKENKDKVQAWIP